MELILLIGIWAVIIGIGVGFLWFKGVLEKGSKYDAYKPRFDNLEKSKRELFNKISTTERELADKTALAEQAFAERSKQLDDKEQAIILMAKEKAVGFPWLANAYAEFFHLEEMKLARALETKSHPAYTAAEKVREAAERRREAERIARILKYQIEFYEGLFPWLADLKSEEIEEELIRIRSGEVEQPDDDAAKKWLTPEEYNRLPNQEKYQIALDRYWTKKKTRWEIGRDYERYIGWRYESQGSSVYYQGIIKGFEDLGRDLIVSNGKQVHIVQCKYWSKKKTIHEKHVFQLYGTMVAFKIDNPEKDVLGHFVTSTSLSTRSRQFADYFGIKITESLTLERYPCIKCNISRRDGERIYHLPFDQQYDTTMVEINRGECYVMTVAEAESKGYRRAFRYRGEK